MVFLKIDHKRKKLLSSGWESVKHTSEFKEQFSQSMMNHQYNVGRKHRADCGHCLLLRERNLNNNPSKNMSLKTRQKMSSKKTGSKNNAAKLNEEKVIELRSSDMTDLELSEKYGISVRTVRSIKKRKSWKHI